MWKTVYELRQDSALIEGLRQRAREPDPQESPIDEPARRRIAQTVCSFLISQGIAAEVYWG